MSKLHQFSITSAVNKGKRLLSETRLEIRNERPQGHSDSDFLLYLELLLNKIVLKENELQDTANKIENMIADYKNYLGKLTGGEREKEAPKSEQFFENVDFDVTIDKLCVEVQRLSNERLCTENLVRTMKAKLASNAIPVVTQVQAREPLVSLPKLQLPNFSGNILEWTSFWEQFQFSVGNADPNRYPPVSKLNYLLGCLRGRAKSLVEGFPIEDASYEMVVKRLQEEFGRPDLILQNLYT